MLRSSYRRSSSFPGMVFCLLNIMLINYAENIMDIWNVT